ncbi:MAG: hypothetical protein ABI830_13765 [Pseudolabrys sp.]
MLFQIWSRLARVRTPVGVALCGLLLAACASAPQRLLSGADPADPAARVPSASYRSVTTGYVSQRPVGPAPWREQNDRVAPSQKQ